MPNDVFIYFRLLNLSKNKKTIQKTIDLLSDTPAAILSLHACTECGNTAPVEWLHASLFWHIQSYFHSRSNYCQTTLVLQDIMWPTLNLVYSIMGSWNIRERLQICLTYSHLETVSQLVWTQNVQITSDVSWTHFSDSQISILSSNTTISVGLW